jgi:hypothetical protein
MDEKTETKPLEAIAESSEIITDYYAKRWYDTGFRFAINYIYVRLLKSAANGDSRVDPDQFKAYLDDLLDIGVEDDYFEKHPFNKGCCPDGQCPGDAPGTCIQCSDPGIIPIDMIPDGR